MPDVPITVVLSLYLYDSKANKFLPEALVVDSITVVLGEILKSCGKIDAWGRFFVPVICARIPNPGGKVHDH